MTAFRVALCVFMLMAIISCAVSRQRPVPDAGPDEWSPIGLEGWEVAWVATAGSPTYINTDSERARNVFALDDGSTVITGQFICEAVFGEGEENETVLVEKVEGSGDGFVAKYGVDGRLEWARSLGGPGDDTGFAVIGLDDGGIIVGGRFEGEAVFSPGEPDEIAIPAGGGSWNAFIARYSQVGELEWVVPFYGSESSFTLTLARGNDQFFYVAGRFRDDIALGGNDETIVLESLGNFDYFVASFTYDGEIVWAKGIGNDSGQLHVRIASLSDGSIVVASAGSHENLKSYSTQVEMEGLGCVLESECTWIARMDPQGDFLWSTSFSSPAYSFPGVSTTVDGNVVLSSIFGGASEICSQGVSAPPGDEYSDNECFAYIKLDTENGSTLWTTAFATPNNVVGAMNPRSSSLSGGNIVMTGNFSGDLFLNGLDDPAFSSVTSNFFVSILNPEGTVLGINAMCDINFSRAWGLDTIGNDTIFVSGTFQSTNYYPTCFGAGYGEDICLTSNGIEDIFLMKLVRSESSPD